MTPDWEGMIRFAHTEIARLRAELAEGDVWAVVYRTAVEENNRLRADLDETRRLLDNALAALEGPTRG